MLAHQVNLAAGYGNTFMSCWHSSVLYSCGGSNTAQSSYSIIPDTVLGKGGTSYLSSIADVEAQYSHVIALSVNGNVWAWGEDTWGQLGDSANINQQYPVAVKGENAQGILDSIKAVAIGYYHSVFLKIDGTVLTCGYNTDGQLGDNSTSHRNYLQKVHGESNVGFLDSIIAISAGAHHSIALKADGTVWAWGYSVGLTPVKVSNLSQVVAISAKGYSNLALRSDSTVWSWGQNDHGQLGTGDYAPYSIPVQVKGVSGIGFLKGAIAVAAGDEHSLVIKSDGTVFSFGYNFYGQLGDGTAIDRNTPVQVLGIGASGFLNNAVNIKAGGQHTICSLNDGRIIGWGRNDIGQLGDSTNNNRAFPVLIKLSCLPTEVNEVRKKIHSEIFPNPFSQTINIRTDNNEPMEIVLYDITSREIMRKFFTNSISLIRRNFIMEFTSMN